MTQDQRRRTEEALQETVRMLVKVEAQKTFDADQEKEKQQRIKFYASHIDKLADMLTA